MTEGDEPADARAADRSWKRALKRYGPYTFAAVAIAVILTRYSPEKIAAEMTRGSWAAMFPWALGSMVVSLLMVSLADSFVIRATVASFASPGGAGRLDYPSILAGKAGATLLNLLGIAAGHGGYGVWIARRTGVGAVVTGGIILYLLMSDLVAMGVVLTLTAWLGKGPMPAVIAVAAPIVLAVLSLTILIGPYKLFGRNVRMFRPWHVVPRSRGFLQAGVRVAQFGMIIVGTWGGANAFGVSVPLAAMATNLPIVMIVSALPVNVAGLGAVQGAWLLLSPWATSGEQVLAFSVVWQLALGVSVVLRGLPFVRRTIAEVADGTSAAGTADDGS